MAKLSIASILNSGNNEKTELQSKVTQLTGVRFGFRNNDRISCRTLQSVIELSKHKRPIFDENEIRGLGYCDKATKAAVFSALLDELNITDLQERQAFMRIPVTASESEFVSQVLGMFV